MACNKLHTVNTVDTTTTSGSVILGFPVSVTAENKDRFCLKFACGVSIPDSAASDTVFVTVNGVSVQVFDKYGNPAVASDFRKRRIYKGYFGTETASHVIMTDVPFNCNPGCNNVL